MKKIMKKIIVVSIILSMIVGVSLIARGYFVENENEIWGEKLKENYDENEKQKKNENYKLSLVGKHAQNTTEIKDIYAAGEDILITNQEIEQAEDYYVLAGTARSKAKEKAEEHVKEQNALYVEAVNHGFDVTTKEIKEYLTELKKILKDAENQEEVQDVMNGFDSEEEYWEYQYEVYQKLLPVQKYVKYLEKQFKQKSSAPIEEVQDKWDAKFEKMKDKFVDEQNFEKVDNADDIHKKFKKMKKE